MCCRSCRYIFTYFVCVWAVSLCYLFFFFFSSRRRHTRFDCDWSSDVCSSDLLRSGGVRRVSIGFEPLQANVGSLDRFKEGLGFQHLPAHQYVRLAPPLATLLRKPLLTGSIACLRMLPRSEIANKAAGLLQWY